VEHLSGSGRVSIFPRPAVSDPAILAEYLGFLRDHRGTCQQTVESQRRHLTQFLKVCAVNDHSSVPRISIEEIDHFLIQKARHLSRVSVNHVCSALRGFLSYLHMRGLLDRDLAKHVTQPRLYRLSSLPRAIDWTDLQSKLPLLATYMGHVDVLSTQVYLRSTPELLREASSRFERIFGSVIAPTVGGAQ
jgi:site-specific recombinase XerD